MHGRGRGLQLPLPPRVYRDTREYRDDVRRLARKRKEKEFCISNKSSDTKPSRLDELETDPTMKQRESKLTIRARRVGEVTEKAVLEATKDRKIAAVFMVAGRYWWKYSKRFLDEF